MIANYFLLYFLVRKFCPKIIVETGVAAGWTTLSILRALDKNQVGKLYSSDFPYFRLPDPEKFIGILVPKHYKENWCLYIKGDENNIKEITGKSISHFRKCSDPADKDHNLHFIDAIKLDLILQKLQKLLV